MHPQDALDKIAEIHRLVGRARTFGGFRSSVTLFSGAVAVVTAAAQSVWMPDPAAHADAYLILWFSAGAVCLAVVTAGAVLRCRQSDSSLQRDLALQVFRQLAPCLVMAGLVTLVLSETAWGTLWIAPGLWSILAGLGLLACRPLLPRGTAIVGAFYLLAGVASITVSPRIGLFSPWLMGVPFGVGQSAAAAILYWHLERPDAQA
jgi:hypothetical protein